MRRWETLSALAAVVLASVGSIPRVPFRAMLTGGAVVLITVVGISRVAAALNAKPKPPASFDPGQRARMIREERSKRRS